MKGKLLRQLLCWLAAGLTAFALLNGWCWLWFRVPVHSASGTGATDYVWEPGAAFIRADEGLSYGTIDANGYNNAWPDPGTGVDILVMGSSYAEGMQVPQQQNMVYRLNALLAENELPLYAYNIGMSDHEFLRCASNLPAALAAFTPQRYVVVETNTLSVSAEQLAAVVNNTYGERPSYSNPLVVLLQKLPFARLIYTQMKAAGLYNAARPAVAATQATTEQAPEQMQEQAPEQAQPEQDPTTALLQWMDEQCAAYGCKLILMYHDRLALSADGAATMQADTTAFAALCAAQDVLFVDMQPVYLKTYNADHTLAYGFTNTKTNVGHWNTAGHRLAAQSLYTAIAQAEGEE